MEDKYSLLDSINYDWRDSRAVKISEQYRLIRHVFDNDEELKISVGQANKALEEIYTEIKSTNTNGAIVVLIDYHYVTRFAFQIYNDRDQHKARDYFVMKFCEVRSNKPISHFPYIIPTKENFRLEVLKELKEKDFYGKVEALCSDLYGLNMSISRLAEESWAYEYKNKIEDLSGVFLKYKKSIQLERNRWEKRKNECNKCLSYIKENRDAINSSRHYLSTLKIKELNTSIKVGIINDAYEIYNKVKGSELESALMEGDEYSLVLFNKLSKKY